MVLETCHLRTIYNAVGASSDIGVFKTLIKRIAQAGGDHAKFITKIATSNFSGDAIKELQVALNTLDDLQLKKFVDDFDEIADVCKVNTAGKVKAWEVLNKAGSILRRNENALIKIEFLNTHGLTSSQLENIGKLNDIKAISIAENLAKRINPSVPLNQIDLIPKNAKSLESIRPNILDPANPNINRVL